MTTCVSLQESSIKKCKETYLLQCFYTLWMSILILTKMKTMCKLKKRKQGGGEGSGRSKKKIETRV